MEIYIILNPHSPIKESVIGEAMAMETDEYDALAEKIITYIGEGTFCKGKIRPGYARSSIQKCRYLVLAYGYEKPKKSKKNAKPKKKIVGFATLWYLHLDKIYLDINCSRKDTVGAGSALMNTINEIGEKEEKNIFLKSYPSVMGFYESFGYSLNLNTHLGNTNNNKSNNSNNNSNSNSNNNNTNSNNSNSNNSINRQGYGLIPMIRKTLKNNTNHLRKTKRRRVGTVNNNNK